MQEPKGYVKSSAAPVFQRVQLAEVVCYKRRYFHQIVGSNTSRQKGLVSITECRVHEQKAFMVAHCFGEGLRTLFLVNVPEAFRRLNTLNTTYLNKVKLSFVDNLTEINLNRFYSWKMEGYYTRF